MLILLSISVLVLTLAFIAYLCYRIHRLENERDGLLRYIMAERDPVAYQVSHPHKPRKKTIEEIEKDKEAAKQSEYYAIINSGEITDEQEKRFGTREDVLQYRNRS